MATLLPQCADSWAHEEQQVINGPNGLNKHDNGRSAVRQSEVRGAHKSLEANREKKTVPEERWSNEGTPNKRGTGRVKATIRDTSVMICQVKGSFKFFASGHSRLNFALVILTLKAYTLFFSIYYLPLKYFSSVHSKDYIISIKPLHLLFFSLMLDWGKGRLTDL